MILQGLEGGDAPRGVAGPEPRLALSTQKKIIEFPFGRAM